MCIRDRLKAFRADADGKGCMFAGQRRKENRFVCTDGLCLGTRRFDAEYILDIDHGSRLQQQIVLIVGFCAPVRNAFNIDFYQAGCAGEVLRFCGNAVELVRDFEGPGQDDAVLRLSLIHI